MKDCMKIAYTILRDKILNCEFTAGQKLREDFLVEMLDMSRTPIRRALNELEHDGLIEIVPNKYSKVAKYSDTYITDIGIVRVGLDIMSVKLAIFYGSNAEFAVLDNLCNCQEEAIDKNDDNKRREIDYMFHTEIARLSKNQILIDMQGALYLKVRHILSYNDISQDKYQSVNMHRKITSAIYARDEEKAVEYVKEHLYDFYKLTGNLDFYSKII